MTHIFGPNGPIHSVFFLICVEQEGASFKTTSSYVYFTWRPPVTKKLIFSKVGPESAPAGRVNIDEIFRNFIFMFYWTKCSLKKKVSKI